ncbi:Hypothetical protein IALB_1563 [Ignavibacterium album JCM 16511]|uniref:DUF3108 domain-containing protein n=1 Tax=Ignavibacterium album (strain DSM 19864 / JCM 16511 / NBRC 101810 / Mat9-16) TaxID=945713 RepID=I0AJW4_IGNAJ|nr:DUF3108 domain-containing protein [Ignavibacterium album]AFH49271.1 Hypothetical protein IALB_1563 [Ignavibacterium album JCM 16511]
MRKASFIFFAVIIFSIVNYNQTKNKIFQNDLPFRKIDVGEEITYVVKYLFISIGEIKLKVTKREITHNDTIYSAIAYIDSYEGLPFVNLHQIYETKFNPRQIPIFFRGTIIDKDTTFTEYTFNYKSNRIHILKGSKTKNEIWTDSSAVLDREYLDGLSLFYYARMRTGRKASYSTPVFINEKGEKTVIRCYDKPEPIEIDAVDYKVNCVYLDGETEFKGIFGLTGYFEGWFSNDEYAVPIYAKMSVIIGNITVELKEWKKKNWTPPKFYN